MLERLEKCVNGLISRYEALKEENFRIRANMEDLMQENEALVKENNSLHEKLAQEEQLRAEALRRIEGLLQKIGEHGSVV